MGNADGLHSASEGRFRDFIASVASVPMRLVRHYTGPVQTNTIEYWQRFIFYVIALSGIVAGTLCIIPTAILIFLKGQVLAGILLVAVYGVNVIIILSPRISVKNKTLIIAINFSLFGVASLIIAGPEGESGIWFTVSVLFCSLFIGPWISLGVGVANFLTGITFGILHSRGLIGWDILRNFHFSSWVVQSVNIFLMDMTFAVANTMLIRGVDATFKALNSAEARIRTSLAEKETLIRELYHRSKNNMQVVSSLLMLHSAELRDGSAKAIFKDIITKIVSMSLVHQRLYESHDLSKIEMAGYVKDLLALMMHSYDVPSERIEVNLHIDEITMLIDMAIPCGLVISEIVTNSLKYAFPNGRKGRIDVLMRRADGDFVELRIADNGVGLPADFSAETHGRMGLKTLTTMVEHQMQGSIELRSDGGVAFFIRFKPKLYEERVHTNA